MISCAISDRVLLALNAAEERIQVVIGSEKELLFAEEIRCPGQSISHLPTAIVRGLTVLGLAVKDLAGIACVRGPGSFTGLRIAHATMQGLSRPFSIPMAGLEYLPLLAAQAARLIDGELWVLTYARTGQVYIQGFTQGLPLDQIQPKHAAEACAVLTARPRPICVLGSGVRKNDSLQNLTGVRVLPAVLDTPTATSLLDAACRANYFLRPPTPLYLRKSDAENNLEAIAGSRGIAFEEARKHIFDFE